MVTLQTVPSMSRADDSAGYRLPSRGVRPQGRRTATEARRRRWWSGDAITSSRHSLDYRYKHHFKAEGTGTGGKRMHMGRHNLVLRWRGPWLREATNSTRSPFIRLLTSPCPRRERVGWPAPAAWVAQHAP